MEEIRVVLIDDQVLFAESLKNILEMRTNDIKVIATAYDGPSGVETVLRLKPDIVLMDIRMPGLSGVEATKILVGKLPNINIMVLTTFNDDEYVYDALKYGAVGYLLKTIPPAELIASIRAINNGTVQISPEVARKLASGMETILAQQKRQPKKGNERQSQWLSFLTYREKELLHYLVEGYTNKKIAELLFIAEQTVKNHLSIIYSKMDVNNRTQALKKINDEDVRL